MAKSRSPLSHFSPVFANRPWLAEGEYICYSRNPYRRKVERRPMGPRQWGRKRGLYKWKVERALNQELETETADIYTQLLEPRELTSTQRITWAQHLLSQFVRTPGFLRYELAARKMFGLTDEPEHDRVGCKDCGDLACITTRDWCLLQAHEDDYFIRGDNPVLLTGFVERAETCLIYPLSPRLCFVACSMPSDWNFLNPDKAPEFLARVLLKGAAFMVNFHLARAAEESVIISPVHDGELPHAMFTDVLGLYPQPPFLLHSPAKHGEEEAFESIRIFMSAVDGVNYPSWLPHELEGLSIFEGFHPKPNQPLHRTANAAGEG